MTYACPKDASHLSTDADYCSECGAKISGAASLPASASASSPASPTAPNASASAELCPVCQTPRAPGARFCEVCRHNFSDPASSGAPTTPLAPVAAPPTPIAAPFAPVAASVAPVAALSLPVAAPTGGEKAPVREGRFEIAIVVDASLYLEPDPAVPAPTERGEFSFPLDLDDNLIGRFSSKSAHKTEIPLGDPGASSRHAKISRSENGAWTLLDLGSTNGTTLNGQLIAPGAKMALSEGDQITLGCWSRLTLRHLR